MNRWGREIVLLHYKTCPRSLFTHVSSKHLLSDCDPGEVIHFHLNQLFQITCAYCIYQRKIIPFFLLDLWRDFFLFGKHLLVSFSCCDRFHSKFLTMKEAPPQTPNLLQGLLWCQVKGNLKGGGNRAHEGPLLSMSVEKQPAGREIAQQSGQGLNLRLKF